MRTLRFGTLAVSLAMLAIGTGCGGSGKAKIQLSKTTSGGSSLRDRAMSASDIPAGGTVEVPTVFQMKFLSAYLAEDVDSNQNNVGNVQRVWVNPDCPSADGCTDAQVGYFDLIDPAAANTQLNSQTHASEIDLGTYRYVRIDFCIGGATGNNVKYKTAAMSAETEVQYGGCGVTSAKLDPPLELKKGEDVTIRLDYDLTQGPLYSISGGSCTSTAPCLSGIQLSPAIVR
jgi:hypothetical protein